MTKEQFLAMSLPYDTKGFVYESGKGELCTLYGVVPNSIIGKTIMLCTHKCKRFNVDFVDLHENVHKEKFKPILHPLSDLTKPITHKGLTFVPAIKLAKIVADIHNNDFDSEWIIRDNGMIICKTPWDLHISIYYKTETIMFSVYDMWNRQENRTRNQFIAFQKLIEWHFDISGLIEKGEAIDVNTLDKNPYE